MLDLRSVAREISVVFSGPRLLASLLILLSVFLAPAIARADYPPDWIWTGAGGSTGDCLLPPYYTPQPYDMTAWWDFGEFLDVTPTWSMPHCEQPGLVLSPSSCTSQGERISVLDYNDDPTTRYYGKGVSIASYYCAGFPNCKPGDRYKNPDGTFVRYFPDHVGGTCVGKTYDILVSPASGGDINTTYIAQVAPSGTTNARLVTNANLVARVFDSQGQLVPNIPVTIQLKGVPGSGGHAHDTDDPSRPLGALGAGSSIDAESLAGTPIPLPGNTGADGSGFAFIYHAPKISGDYQIIANCPSVDCTQKGASTMWVGLRGLISLKTNPTLYILRGSRTAHPGNHYLTPLALDRLYIIAALYRDQHQPVLYLNDSSLERGGVFDILRTWAPPHFEHACGTAIDIRANGAEGALNITSETDPMKKEFQKLAAKTGTDAMWDVPTDSKHQLRWDLRHFHARLWSKGESECQ